MDYTRFEYLKSWGPHSLLIPVYVPESLLQNESHALKTLKRQGIPLSDPQVKYEVQEYANTEPLDVLVINRRSKNKHGSLRLMARVETDMQPELRETVLEAYRKFAGEKFESRLFEPYQKPLSRVSPQEGIYFSPQDTLTLEVTVFSPDERILASAGVQDRSAFYYAPRISFFGTKKTATEDPLERSLAEYFIKHAHELPETSPYSAQNTNQGLTIIDTVIEAYAKALGKL